MNRERGGRARSGFTLIEMTVVLAILVVAAGLIIARVGGWSSRQSLNASARSLGNVIRVWRERARVEETSYTLLMEGNSYRITEGKEVLRSGRLEAGGSFDDATPSSIIFRSRGAMKDTRIAIRNPQGDRVTLLLGALVNEIEYEAK